MATKTIRVSDLSGSEEGVEAISFALAGQAFTLDLTAKEREMFLKSFERYTAVATPESTTQRASKAKTEKSGPTQAQLMREWAKANSIALPDRGVVPKEVREQYRAAMAKEMGAALKEQGTGGKQEDASTPAKPTPARSTASKPTSTPEAESASQAKT